MPHDLALVTLVAPAVFALLAATAGWLATRPMHALALVLALVLADASQLPLAFHAGLWIYPEDVVFAVLALACMVRLSLFARSGAVPRAWWLIGAVQLALAAWGTTLFGTGAGVDARGHFYLWIAVLYFCSVRWTGRMVGQVLDAWIACSLALCALVAWRWGRALLDPAYEQALMALDTTGVRFRVIGSGPALMICTGALALMFRMRDRTRRSPRWLLPWQLATILLLQHRSVWVGTFVGVLVLAWTGRDAGRTPRMFAAALLLAVPLALLAVLPAQDDGMLASVRMSADQALSLHEGTMVGRVVNWQDLLGNWAASKDPVTWLVGKPYGSGYNPFALGDGTMVDMVPHNHFVHMLYRGGLAGLAATLWLFWRVWRAALAAARAPGGGPPAAPFFLAALSALFAYCIPYWVTYDSGVLLGIAIGCLSGAAGAEPRIGALRVAGFRARRQVPRFAGTPR